ncbi:MAG: class I tRNA ligase family protein, partial [Candidatus Diapherotrites archaeon]|nr:class I tRNA ligase family protein [Candidatus Diapherotrites archaeon]
MSVKAAEPRVSLDVEKGLIKEWKDSDVRGELLKLRKDGKPFFFHDGPPYASGSIHLGTALNKIIKDVACRFHWMTGNFVFDRVGYDMHGLPIELQVEKSLGLSKTEIEGKGLEEFIDKCREFAIEKAEAMNADFEDLGVNFDFKNAYKTITPDYIYTAWGVFKAASEKSLLYKGKFPAWICPSCETTEAYNEIEHKPISDSSIYVKFPIVGRDKEFLIIWTTTAWTLPSNSGVMANPLKEYVKVKVGDEFWVLAKELVETVMQKVGIKDFKVVETFSGATLEHLRYESPLKSVIAPLPEEAAGAYRVVLTDRYVTVDEGTGLVHTAPGHGETDYIVGMENRLPVWTFVGINGIMTKEAGVFAEKHVFKTNKEITDYLKDQGSLVFEDHVTHDYPHCWRCASKLLTLCLDNWFIKVTDIRDDMAAANKKVVWRPGFAQSR